MKRLIKKSDNNNLIQHILDSLSKEGRGVLKRIEDYKFKLDQSTNMLQSNQSLQNKLKQKLKIIDSASAQIYGIVFDMENYDLTPNTYDEKQLALTTPAEAVAPVNNAEKSDNNTPEKSEDEEEPEEENESEDKSDNEEETKPEKETEEKPGKKEPEEKLQGVIK